MIEMEASQMSMSIGWGTVVSGVVLLLLGAFFSTLHVSLRLAGDAGVPRFMEKYPNAARFGFWTQRWQALCGGVNLVWAALLVAGLVVLAPVVGGAGGWTLVGRFAALLLGVVLCYRIIPVSVAESYADRVAILFLPLAVGVTAPLYPLALGVAALEQALVEMLLRQSPDANRPSSEDEIISVVDHADADDLEEAEREMIRSVLEFGETVTREIMTHRVDIIAFEHTASVEECVEKSKQAAFSRFPVYAESLDDVRGVVHVKDLLRSLSEDRGEQPIAALCKKVTFVPETMPIDDLFRQLRAARAQLALVVDEYGGTAGLVSIEDIIEELVGEIHDEYDPADARVQALPDGSYLVDAREPVHEVNEQLELEIPESDEYDSIGGYIFQTLGQIPSPGETITQPGFELRVQSAVPHRILQVRIIKTAAAPDA